MQLASKLHRLLWLGLLLPALAFAQGITTAALNGTVADNKGQALIGVNVVATHTPSGSIFGAVSRGDGRFNIPGVRVGGPYTVTATHVGYKTQKKENVYLALGQDLKIEFALPEEAVELGETVVVAERDEVFSASRTGAANNISAVEMQRLPTLGRGVSDFARLTPQSTGFNSFVGRNNLYNNISIDGSVFNNVFGLASEVGGQTNSQPISLDAVEEIQISLAPYDVRQGSFTGADISLITRAGTNKLQGAAYSYYRNESLISDKVEGASLTNPDLSQRSFGLRLAGPIIHDKAFLFANAELGRRDDPGSTFRAKRTATETGSDISNILYDDINGLRNFLLDPNITGKSWTFNPGEFESYFLKTSNDKITARFDLNLNQTNRLTFRYNYLKSFRDTPISNSGTETGGGRQPSSTRLPFSGSNYLINNNFHSIIGQLNSTFGNKYANQFVAGFTALRDFREGKVDPFPLVDIQDGAGRTIIAFGYEPFTPNNKLDSDIFQVSDNFSAYYGKHTITVGTAHEFYSFSNGFTPDFYSRYRFRSQADFINHVTNTKSIDTNNDKIPDAVPQPTLFSLTYSAVKDVEVPLAEISALQASVYAQDEYQVTPRLKLTMGLRMDVPIYTKDLTPNPTIAALTFANGEKIDVSKLPDATPLWSPRIGFNFDASGDRSVQLRGGTGVFTGKIPFVWLSNQASNNGLLFGSTFVQGNGTAVLRDPATGKNITFTPDYKTYVPANPTVPSTVLINATAKDFKFPQVWRSNFAIDGRLPYGFIGTVEAIYSKDINAVFHRNVNLEPATKSYSGADKRLVYPARLLPSTASSAQQDNASRINDNVTNAIILDNTSTGYQYALTFELRKQFNQGFASLAYTNAEARDLTSSTSAIAATAFNNNQIINSANDPVLGYASNDQRHRIVGTASYRLNYLGLAGTTLSLVYVGASAFNFTYSYAGDMNGDRISGNDLLYIPTDATNPNEIRFAASGNRSAAQQAQEFEAFIRQDKYLSAHRGEYARRGAATAPWFHRWDLSLKHEFRLNVGGQRNGIEVSFDIINFGNLLNSKWGLIKTTNTTQPLSYSSYDAASNMPLFTFPLVGGQVLKDTFKTDSATLRADGSIASRWLAQFGIRYAFN